MSSKSKPDTIENKIALFNRKHREIECKLSRQRKFLISLKIPYNIKDIQMRFDNLKQEFEPTSILLNELIISIENAGLEVPTFYKLEFEKSEDEYFSIKGEMNEIISFSNNFNHPNSTIKQSISSTISNQQIRLPEITIPKFDGSIEHWQSFRDKFLSRIGENPNVSKFLSRIGENPNVSPLDKMQYLQFSLVGKAARAIEAIGITSSNLK
ncbi:hypothetical protein HHI36_023913 [Cryptolaemus montrouzieri]|uniref:Uncharacterized protein n=1 Tax=Cryptolaemus montrouzieri TaxID=559131 RepID=A0ABD2PHT5_9CUCU